MNTFEEIFHIKNRMPRELYIDSFNFIAIDTSEQKYCDLVNDSEKIKHIVIIPFRNHIYVEFINRSDLFEKYTILLIEKFSKLNYCNGLGIVTNEIKVK